MLEVIGLNEIDSAKLSKTKATQMEYCPDIDKDGLSPNVDAITKTLAGKHLPLRVMVRSHFDTFVTNNKHMSDDIEFIRNTRDLDIDGYVWGAITEDKKIDFNNLERILTEVNDKNITFHKAFDKVENKMDQIQKLLKYKKVKFILTSGGQGSPLDNISFFKSLPNEYKNKILVGGGVNKEAISVLKPLGYKNFHIGKLARIEGNYTNEYDTDTINNVSNSLQ